MGKFPSNILRSGVSLANKLTKGVQSQAKIERWTGGQTETGKKTFAPPIYVDCIESSKQRVVVSSSGQAVTVMSTLLFLDPIEPLGTPGRREPIDPGDRITAPSGFTGPIIETGATIDPETKLGFTTPVMLGRR